MSALQLVDKETGEVVGVLPTFDDFWTLFPRRVAKKDAFMAWSRLKPEQQMQAVVACAAWRKVWAKTELQYVPHGATWLNGWRFEDELPPDYTQSTAAHAPAALPAQGERTVMPDHVRALLAKLRAK